VTALSQRQLLDEGYEHYESTAIQLARENITAFCHYVMRDEYTGKPIDLAYFQEEWHYLADTYDRLVIWAFANSGKTQNLTVARTLFRLGQNPSLRFAIVCASSGPAVKIMSAISQYIESSRELGQVFPHLRPDARNPWNTEQITVKRPYISSWPSVAVGAVGVNIQGVRIDEAILDDVVNRENTHSPYRRAELLDWYLKSIPGRINPETGRILLLGNAFHPEDLLHTVVKSSRWHGFKYPILNPDETPRWPERWPLQAIENRKAELILPSEIASQLFCECRDDSSSRFKRSWIDDCMRRGLGQNGQGSRPVYALKAVPWGCKVYCGVDLGVGRGQDNDLTVFFVLLVHPNGDREVLWVESGRWLAAEIMAKVIEYSYRFQCIFVVENNAAQDYLVQLLHAGTAIPIVPYTTGRNKADPTFGFEAMAAEFAACKWIIPNMGGSMEPEIEAWVSELLGYRPKPAHTGDRAMASWLAKEGERLGQVDKPPPAIGAVTLNLLNW
jgi:hypothetical protein